MMANPNCFGVFYAFVILAATSQAFTVNVRCSSSRTRLDTSNLASLQSATTDSSTEDTNNNNNPRRHALETMAKSTLGLLLVTTIPTTDPAFAAGSARIDVNNALAREYTAFPGLFPTVASKIVKGAPYTSKKEVYAVLNELERSRLKDYDKAIVINKPDAQLKQFKTSQICKYECGGRVSSAYRDEQIKAVQTARRGYQ